MTNSDATKSSEAVEDCRRQKVREDHQEGGFHNRGGGGMTNGFRTAADSQALQAADVDNDGGEQHALDQHEGDVAQEYRLSHRLEVNAKTHVHAEGQEQVPGEDPHKVCSRP